MLRHAICSGLGALYHCMFISWTSTAVFFSCSRSNILIFTAKTAENSRKLNLFLWEFWSWFLLKWHKKQVTWSFSRNQLLISHDSNDFHFSEDLRIQELISRKIKWLEFFATSRVIRTRILRKSVSVSLKGLAAFAVYYFFPCKDKKKKRRKEGMRDI